MLYKILSKRAQIGETMTWVIATIIIVLILVFSIFLASLIGGNKEFDYKWGRSLIGAKSLTAYLLTEEGGNRIYYLLKERDNLDEDTGPLALKIFNYPVAFWMGIYFYNSDRAVENDYFDSQTRVTFGRSGKEIAYRSAELIPLGEDKYIEVDLNEKLD